MPIGLMTGVAAAIGGGSLIGSSLIAKKASSNASKAQQQLVSPLIGAQTEASKWALQQAQTDIPKARETLGGPLAFWNKILSGDRNTAMSVYGPTADQLAGQTAAAYRSQSEFAPRGGRRTLMLGNLPISTVTNLNQGLLALRPQAAGQVVNIGQILAQLGLGEQNAATSGNASAISGALGLANLQNQASAQNGAILHDLGSGIGDLLRILMTKSGGASPQAPRVPAIPPSVLAGPPVWNSMGSDPTGGH